MKYFKIEKPDEIEEYILLKEDPFFLGEHDFNDYKVTREYLHTEDDDLKLYYTKFEPKVNIRASYCIIHGLGEYSARFLEVIFHLSHY